MQQGWHEYPFKKMKQLFSALVPKFVDILNHEVHYVDDNQMARMAMKQLVSQVKDLKLIRECAHAMEAYNAINEEPVDLLLLDIEMPDMTVWN
jgi:response regulator RpfG family c-di-GMP phosphodiesterase